MFTVLHYLCMLLQVSLDLAARSDWLVVCASGITCGGKSTITKSLHQLFNSSVLIKQDDYYFPDNDPRHEQLPALHWRNRELITSLDMERMRNDVEEVLSRKEPTSPLLILDGFMLYYDKFITCLCDLKYFFLLSKEACKVRRKKRNKRIPLIDNYFKEYVWPAYLKYRDTAFRENPDAILVDGGANNETIIQDIATRINQHMSYKRALKASSIL